MTKKIKQCFDFHSIRAYIGCVFALIAFILSCFIYKNFKAGLLFSILFFIAGIVKIPDNLISEKKLQTLYIAWIVLTAVVVLFLSQFCMNEVFPERLLAAVFGVLLIVFLYMIPIIVFLRVRCTTIVLSFVCIVFSCVNYFVFLFRGSEIIPADILSIATAGNVAAEYSFKIPAFMFYSLVLFIIYCFASYALPKIKIVKHGLTRLWCSVTAISCIALVWFGGYSIKPLHWLQTGSVRNGYLFNFTILLRDSFPQKPDKYNYEAVNVIADAYKSKEDNSNKRPDIIVIMDESFSDLAQLGNSINTNIEITPFVNSLEDNTLHGYALSSVFGGGTPNSEYEFLTGNSFLFLPTGSIAYQQFINEPVYSIARDLSKKGYSTIAMHQYLANSWMRDRIWPLLGFDKCLFIDDIPQKDVLRGWGTDQEMFETVASVYEEHRMTTDDPIFVFAVTIQNHGGYKYIGDDFVPSVKLEGYSQAYPDVEQYLSCVNKTDEAVKWLIEYYESIDRDVVILFYGDHFPRLDDTFFEEVHGGPFDTLGEQMLEYRVPFFIWTNYKSKTEYVDCIGINYLSNLLYERANIAMPPYNQYLETLRRTIPYCNSFGYYSISRKEFIPLNEAQDEERKALLEYNYLEWNSIFDDENKNKNMFPVE